jgi:uncharacterized membrane protein YsdA (DUF1294 family)
VTLTDYFFLGYFILVNLFSFSQFRRDKVLAREGGWRVSEFSLLATAFFGGGVGAKLGQRIFRHKTRKEPFRSKLNSCSTIGLAALGTLAFVPPAREAAFTLTNDVLSGVVDHRAVDRPSSGGSQAPTPFRTGGGSTF